MKTVLITGGTGLVGKYLSKKLKKVILLQRLEDKAKSNRIFQITPGTLKKMNLKMER